MVFSSVIFLFFFLFAALLTYYAVPRRARNAVLLVYSLAFYFWGERLFVLLMVFCALAAYFGALMIDKTSGKTKKAVLVISLISELSMLFWFKYADFFIASFAKVTGLDISILGIALPIGISFYTFQAISYTVDVYKEKVAAQKNIIDFCTYLMMFPQLIAGPIVQYKDVECELTKRRENVIDFSSGVERLVIGFAKKVIIANRLGEIWQEVFVGTKDPSALLAWLGAVCFSFQIYFDFSAYSDMAIGLGRMFGFHFKENFDLPYRAKSITDFWRRWHISLSTWFRDYVYIPLGGSRCKISRNIINLLITWALTGLWHGASWNFVIWGAYFGILLILEKYVFAKLLDKIPVFIRRILTLFLVVISWVIFAAESMPEALSYLGAMFGKNGLYGDKFIYVLQSHLPLMIAALAASVIRIKEPKTESGTLYHVYNISKIVLLISLFAVGLMFLIGGTYNPFLYFRF